MSEDPPVPPGVDPTTPSPARMYDYYLGGTTNYAVDREAAERIRAVVPEMSQVAWANRGFHQRAARWMAGEQGIRQFIDIGSGLPTQNSTHEALRREVDDARVVYVDIDPMVAAYAAGLLTDPASAVLIVADMRDPERLLADPVLRGLVDIGAPVGLLMTAVLHFVPDDGDPWGLVRRYSEALAPGSYLALSHATLDKVPPRGVSQATDAYVRATSQLHFRSGDDVRRLFDGLELVPPYAGAQPGIAHLGVWGAEDPDAADSDDSRWAYCGVARRP